MVRQYVGARYVPKIADPVEWQDNTAYEALVIVTYNNSSYTSRKPVPVTVGIPPENTEYWALTGNYNAQIEEYRQLTEQAVQTANSAKETANQAQQTANETKESVDGFDARITKNASDIATLTETTESQGTEIDGLTSRIETLEGELGNADVDYANTYIVHKNSDTYPTINSAIEQAITDGVSLSNPKTILVYAGDYNEQIVRDDIHGLSIVGVDRDSVIIHYNGSYPDCVIHVQGDISFENVTIKLDNSTTYAIHVDPSQTNVSGVIRFERCNIIGGTNAIGYGSGTNMELLVKYCTLSTQGDCVLYAHNSPYNKTGQKLTVINNLFKLIGNSQLYLRIDDAGYTNGQTTSVMQCLFSGNCTNYQGYGKMQFRKNTGQSSTFTTYMPLNDSNIKFNANSINNSGMPGVNYREGTVGLTGYLLFPVNANTDGEYEVTMPTPFDTQNYTATLSNVTIPGIGEITGQCSISGYYGYGVNVKTTNGGASGKTLAVNIQFKCK